MGDTPTLQFCGIKKKYGENVVLTGVDFEVQPGEIVSLVGENGAGKSTLMNILFGMDVIRETGGFEGEVRIAGETVHIESPQDAIRYGIGMVHQEFMLIPGYTVMQNIKLNREPVRRTMLSRLIGKSFDLVDKQTMRADAERALHRVGIDADPEELVSMLPVGLKQFVEICREVDKQNIRLLVFDEPTAVLTESEAEKLLDCLRSFAADGISIIFISHRLDEVMEISDRVVILRDGTLVKNDKKENLTKKRIAELMVGRELTDGQLPGKKRELNKDDIILEFQDVSVEMPGEKLVGANIRVRRGEIFGVGGLAGHGKIAVANAVSGMYPVDGRITYNGEQLHIERIGEALRHNIAFVSEDRKGVGLLLDRPITDNIVFSNIIHKKQFLKKGLIPLYDAKAAREEASRMSQELEIRCKSPDDLVGSLSGGNQQKVCLARALISEPQMLFVSEPTRGIDIGAKKLILERLRKLNEELGITIVMISSELAELRSICDRIAIVACGEIQGILLPNAADADFALMMSADSQMRQRGGESNE